MNFFLFLFTLSNNVYNSNHNNFSKNLTSMENTLVSQNSFSNFQKYMNGTTDYYNTGIDYRCIIDKEDSILNRIKIIEFLRKKRVLDALLNENVATLQKIDIIKKHDILEESMGPNIYAGGLLDDYFFEF